MSTEKSLQQNAINLFKGMGWFAGKVEMTGRRGFPDVFLRTPVDTVLIEFKHPNGKGVLSCHQQRVIKDLKKLGQRVEVIDSMDAVEELAFELKKRSPRERA